jgi:poly-gamma-glutamate synthesis protein (capsule biosynthesis protein)
MKKIKIAIVGDAHIERPEPESAFTNVLDLLKNSDFRFCQLESVVSDRGIMNPDVTYPGLRVSPEMVKGLVSAGFNAVTMAGNAKLNFGVEALFDTVKILSQNGIESTGVGKNIDEARRPRYFVIDDVTISIINACSIFRAGYSATKTRPGISPLHVSTFYEPLENIYEQPGTPCRTITIPNIDDLNAICSLISEAKTKADFVIACFHWGVHFAHDLAMYQPDVAYASIDAGADVVVGTHPHCLQAMDTYKKKPIFYSMGNIVFDEPLEQGERAAKKYLRFYGFSPVSGAISYRHPQHCRYTMIVHLTLSKNDFIVEITPAYIGDNATPRVVDKKTSEGNRIFKLIKDLNAEWGTELEEKPTGFLLPLDRKKPDTRALIRNRMMSFPWLYRLRVAEEKKLS